VASSFSMAKRSALRSIVVRWFLGGSNEAFPGSRDCGTGVIAKITLHRCMKIEIIAVKTPWTLSAITSARGPRKLLDEGLAERLRQYAEVGVSSLGIAPTYRTASVSGASPV
jgi:hypothetical protein